MESDQIDVVAALIPDGDRFLITKRPPDKHLGGHWEFPGGKPENGESDEAALRRELREEIRLEVTVKRLVHSVEHAYDDRTVHLRFYLCTPESGAPTPEPDECADLSWVTPEEMENLTFPPADDRLIERLRERDVPRGDAFS